MSNAGDARSSDATAPRGAGRDDPRSRRSRALLETALLRLIEDRPFEKITLRQITAEAGVSYPTVFAHYAGKEALFQAIACGEIADLLAAFRTGIDAPGWRPGLGVCAHVVARRALWRTLLTAGASEAMRSEFVRRGRDIPMNGPGLGHDYPRDLVSGVIAGGIFEIVAWWLAQAVDTPAGRVADMLETLVIEPALGLPRGHFTRRTGAFVRVD